MSQVANVKRTRGTETSKYPQEKKSTEILLVAASERELGQTNQLAGWGCRTATCIDEIRRRSWEAPPKRVKVSYPKVDSS